METCGACGEVLTGARVTSSILGPMHPEGTCPISKLEICNRCFLRVLDCECD